MDAKLGFTSLYSLHLFFLWKTKESSKPSIIWVSNKYFADQETLQTTLYWLAGEVIDRDNRNKNKSFFVAFSLIV